MELTLVLGSSPSRVSKVVVGAVAVVDLGGTFSETYYCSECPAPRALLFRSSGEEVAFIGTDSLVGSFHHAILALREVEQSSRIGPRASLPGTFSEACKSTA